MILNIEKNKQEINGNKVYISDLPNQNSAHILFRRMKIHKIENAFYSFIIEWTAGDIIKNCKDFALLPFRTEKLDIIGYIIVDLATGMTLSELTGSAEYFIVKDFEEGQEKIKEFLGNDKPNNYDYYKQLYNLLCESTNEVGANYIK